MATNDTTNDPVWASPHEWISTDAITRSFLTIGAIGIAASLILIGFYNALTPEALVSIVVIAILLAVAYILVRLRYLWLAPRFIIVALWTYLTFLTAYLGGLDSPVFDVFILLIFASGLLLGPRWSLVMGIIAALTATLFFMLDVRTATSGTSWELVVSHWITNSTVAAVSGILAYYSMAMLQSTSTRLHESAERLRSQARVLEHMSDAVITTDLECNILSWNPQAETMYGWSAKEVIGRPLGEIIPTTFESGSEESVKAQLWDEGSWSGEVEQKARGGFRIDVMNSLVLMRNEADEPVAIVSVSQNITKRKAAEMALRKSESRFRSLVEQSPISTVLYESDGRPVLFNPAAIKLWRASPEQLRYIKEEYNILEDPEHIAKGTMQAIKRGFAGEVVRTPAAAYETREPNQTLDSQSEIRYVRSYLYPIKNERGEVELVVIMHEDMSDVVRAEEALRQAQKLESMAVMSGGIAHDFNNLLTVIMAQASLARAKVPGDFAVVEHLDKVIHASENAARLTQQLLAYSGRGQFEIQTLNLNHVIQETAQLLHVVLPPNVNLSIRLKEQLPQVEADTAQIQQIVMNLIINSAEACPDGKGSIVISTDTLNLSADNISFKSSVGNDFAEGEYVLLCVQDTGSGMNERTLSRIFDPFFSTKETGRGLGMAAVVGIVRSHRGDLSVESKEGQGTTIKLILPSVAETPREETERELRVNENPTTGQILVIDDEEFIRDAIREVLSMQGLKCRTFCDGESGLAFFNEGPENITLAIVDLKMPGLSGEETCKRLLELRPELPIIVSSGYSEPEATHNLSQMGITEFLQKPFAFDTLVARVLALLASSDHPSLPQDFV